MYLLMHLFQWQCIASETLLFSSRPFLKQLASHVSADTLQLKLQGMKFFLIHPRN